MDPGEKFHLRQLYADPLTYLSELIVHNRNIKFIPPAFDDTRKKQLQVQSIRLEDVRMRNPVPRLAHCRQ